MPKTKLSSIERQSLSKDTLLKWYVKENKSKLKALRHEINDALKSGAKAKIERLRKIIIENTKRELKKQKDLTEKQRNEKAKQFADKFIKSIKENKNIGDVFFKSRFVPGPEKEFEGPVAGGNREKLVHEWIHNNPEQLKPIKDSPKHFAMKEIRDIKVKQEAYMLLGLIEKIWDKDTAWNVYNNCWQMVSQKKPGILDKFANFYKKHFRWWGVKEEALTDLSVIGLLSKKGGAKEKYVQKGAFNIEKLRRFFTRSRTNGRLGFYYGTRTIKWDPDASLGTWTSSHFQSTIHFKYKEETTAGFTDHYKVYVKGWWAHDEISEIKGYEHEFDDEGKNFETDILGRLRSSGNSRYGDTGDEWLGRDFLEASKYVGKELYGKAGKTRKFEDRDSGLDMDQEELILKTLKDLKQEAPLVYGTSISKKAVEWFNKPKRRNKWIRLDNESVGYFNYLFGREVGAFLYRYQPDQKRIYFVKMQGVELKGDWHDVGFIDIKDGKINEWHDKEDPELFLKKELADKLKDKEVKEELAKSRVEKLKGTKEEKLAVTSGVCAKLTSLTKVVEYRNINEHFIGSFENSKSLKGALKVYLKKQGYKEAVANELATIRAEYVEKQIKEIVENKDEIEKYEVIKKAVEDNPNEKLRIIINSKDEVTITLEKKGLLKKIKDKLKKKKEDLEEAATGAGAILKNAMKQIEKKVSKFAGPLSPLVMWFVKKVMNIEKYLTKQIKGEPTIIGSIITGVFGVKLGASMLGSQKVDQEKFEKIAKRTKKKQTLKKKMYFDEAITLKGYRIVIPKGEGIVPGQEFDVDLSGKGTTPIKPEKKKFRIFGGSDKFQHDDHEITINNKTKIPKGTVIPKGSKIYKV